MIEGLPVDGQRTRIRRLRISDLRDFQAYRTDPDVARFQGWAIQSDSDAEASLASMAHLQSHEAGTWLQLGIALPHDDRLIGDIGVCWQGEGEPTEIGYSVARPYQGRGLATDAIGTVCTWIAMHYKTSRIKAITLRENTRSIKLLERLNFVHTDTLENDLESEFVYCLQIQGSG